MEKERIPLKLQFFAEALESGESAADESAAKEQPAAESGTAGAEAAEAESGQNEPTDQTGKATPADEKSSKEDIAALVAEEIKKASMTPEEKEKYEAAEREKKLADREALITQRELQADAKELLAENGLPAGFRDMALGKDKEETVKNVKALKTQFDSAVQAQVETRLKGKTPSVGSGISGSGAKDALVAEVERYL